VLSKVSVSFRLVWNFGLANGKSQYCSYLFCSLPWYSVNDCRIQFWLLREMSFIDWNFYLELNEILERNVTNSISNFLFKFSKFVSTSTRVGILIGGFALAAASFLAIYRSIFPMDDVSKRFSFLKVYLSQIVVVGFYLENNHYIQENW